MLSIPSSFIVAHRSCSLGTPGEGLANLDRTYRRWSYHLAVDGRAGECLLAAENPESGTLKCALSSAGFISLRILHNFRAPFASPAAAEAYQGPRRVVASRSVEAPSSPLLPRSSR